MPEYSPADVERQLERILSSPGFAHAGRMARFLRFAVESALAGNRGDLKEYSIGVGVFDRRPDYDPRLDPVVRVEARRLRSKLEEYYRDHAQPGELVIELPKGSYGPLIRSSAAPEEKPVVTPRRTLAVLRFANLSPDPDVEYFSDGLTQELIHRITAADQLKVVAWNTVARMIGSEQEVLSAARALGVTELVAGNVRIAGDRLRVMAQLIETAGGTYLWTETYDRRIDDIFAIQDEIASSIARALAIKLGLPGARGTGTRNLEAYKLYLQGRYHCERRTKTGLYRALGLFDQAVALDASFAAAHAGRADACTLLADYSHEAPRDAIPKAKQAVLQALAIDPALAEAEAVLALILSTHEWQWEEAEAQFRQSIRHNPNYAPAHHWYSVDLLAPLGRFAEAEREIGIAMDLDPLSPIIREGVGMLSMWQRRYEDALAEHQRTIELDPYFYKAHAAMGRVLILMGRCEDALRELETARSLAGDVPTILSAIGQAYGLLGKRDQALEYLAQLQRMSETQFVPYSALAIVHLGLGEREQALDWLERACERHDTPCGGLMVHPVYAPLRQEPRFIEVLRKVGLIR